MKRASLLKSLLALFSVMFAVNAHAQYSEVMGKRLIISGTGVSGIKLFTYSSDVTPSWGHSLDSTWQNVPLVAASPDITACGSLSSITGNSWVLIQRGNCEFGAKALAAQNAGAKGVIIYNNVPGAGPIGMGAGASGASVTIPVLMISNDDGNAIRTAIGAGAVTVSLTKWGFGYAHDLSIVPGSTAAGHNGAAPFTQLATGSPDAYKFYTGALIANTGTNSETNIKIKQTTTFTPTGGSATTIFSDSATISSIAVADSIKEAFSPRSFSNNQSVAGRYATTYTVTADAADNNTTDNSYTTYVDVTPQVFSKGAMNSVSQTPIANRYLSLGSNPNFSWGPLFYVNKGGYTTDKVVLSVSDNDTSKHSLSGAMTAFIFKWADGSNGGTTDGYMESRELSLKSIAGRSLVSTDSNSQPLTLPCGDANGLPGTVTLEDNSWYWVAVDVPQNWFLGCDNNANYYTRTSAAQKATTPFNDYWAPLYAQGVPALQLATTDSVRQIPFGSAFAFMSHVADSIPYQQAKGSVPAVAWFLSPFTTAIKSTEAHDKQVVVYPNPATNVVNVKFDMLNDATVNYVRVIDGMGRNVYRVEQNKVKQGTVSISTSGFAPGNYYILIGTDNSVLSRPFKVIAE